MARLHSGRNHLGLEIRQPLVEAAEAERTAEAITNLRFLFCNANVSLPGWLRDLPSDRLELVTLQFPDPWFKKRHHKRRVLQPSLLHAIATAMAPGRNLFLQSDVLAVIAPMVALVELSGCFAPAPGGGAPWCDTNPLPVPTERERLVSGQDLPVFRALFERTDAPVPCLEVLEEAGRRVDNPDQVMASPTPAP
jgi:tRNA (guanine-N7-)-methyltransferase